MGHAISGLIARWSEIDRATAGLEQAIVAPLQQGFGLMLIEKNPAVPLEAIDPRYEALGSALSRRHGGVAFVVTDYFGGAGTQAAAAWRNGDVLMPYSGPEQGSINRALALIGVRHGTAYDLYAEVGLGRYRSNENWIEYATSGKASWER